MAEKKEKKPEKAVSKEHAEKALKAKKKPEKEKKTVSEKGKHTNKETAVHAEKEKKEKHAEKEKKSKAESAEGKVEKEDIQVDFQEIQQLPQERRREKKKPVKEKKSSPNISAKEVEDAVIGLANAGHTASEIGLQLKEQFGIQKVQAITKKPIGQILSEHSLLPEIPEDLMSLVKKSVKIKKHLGKNRKDTSAKRGFQITVSKIRKLANYYSEKGKLPKDWKYTEETAELLVK